MRICPSCNNVTTNFNNLKDFNCDDCKKVITTCKIHGITPTNYYEMLKDQDGRCAICNDKIEGKTLHIDHCHNLGHVRGLLCIICNAGLGFFKDNPYRLKFAIKYLVKNEVDRSWWFQKDFD